MNDKMKELHIVDTTGAESTEQVAKMIFLSGAEAMHIAISKILESMAKDFGDVKFAALCHAIKNTKDEMIAALGDSFNCEKKGES